jgi:sugar lactone lactonase YvrE
VIRVTFLPLWLSLAACHHECADGDVCLLIGSGEAGFNGDGLPATESWLYLPTDVLRAPDGRLLVVDYNNYRLRVVAADGTLETIVGDGEHAFSEPGKPVLQTPLENPITAVVGPDGRLYLACEHEGRVLVDADGVIAVVAGTGFLEYSGDGGDPLQAGLYYPSGLAFDDTGALYVSDDATNRVRRIADGVIDTVVGGGLAADGPGTDVALAVPQHVSWDDPRGRLLIADSENDRVIAWDRDSGIVSLILGGVARPSAAVAAPDGTVFVASASDHAITAVAPEGEADVVLGLGFAGFADPEPIDASEALLNHPSGLFVDGSDLLVTNMLSHQVVVFKGAIPGG